MRSTVIIADADRDASTTCCKFFIDRGYEVRTVESGVECLRTLRSFRPGLLVLDARILWGGVDGVLDCIRHDSLDHFAPLIILTGSERAAVLSRRTGIPRSQCLQKPFCIPALVESVVSAAASLPRDELQRMRPSEALCTG